MPLFKRKTKYLVILIKFKEKGTIANKERLRQQGLIQAIHMAIRKITIMIYLMLQFIIRGST